MDMNQQEIVRHHRINGDGVQTLMEWLPYLKYIAKKPRSLHNSRIVDMMPSVMQEYSGSCDNSNRGKVLNMLSELADRTGFDRVIRTVEQTVVYQTVDLDSLRSLYRYHYADTPLVIPLETNEAIPKVTLIPFANDLTILDRALQRGSAANG